MTLHAARLESSPRLQRVADLLADGREHTTMEIIQAAGVCDVNSIVAELRSNGFEIFCRRCGDVWVYWQPEKVTAAHCGKVCSGVACRMPAGSACPDCTVSLHDFGGQD